MRIIYITRVGRVVRVSLSQPRVKLWRAWLAAQREGAVEAADALRAAYLAAVRQANEV